MSKVLVNRLTYLPLARLGGVEERKERNRTSLLNPSQWTMQRVGPFGPSIQHNTETKGVGEPAREDKVGLNRYAALPRKSPSLSYNIG